MRSRLWLRLRVMYRRCIAPRSQYLGESEERDVQQQRRKATCFPFTSDGAMKNKRRKRAHPPKPKDAPAPLPSSTTTMYLQRGDLSILSALASELPDVFYAEILPKLEAKDTLNLAQVSKWCRDIVWSVGGVRSLEAKLKVYAERNLSRPSSWLSYAACFGNVPAVRALLESGVDANKSCNPEYLPLCMAPIHLATEFGHPMIVKLLIDAGVDVNQRATMSSAISTELVSNVTALNLAATWDQAPVIIELVKAGADINIADNRGRTPINNAAEFGNNDCVALLVAYDADINIADNDGNTPMKRALKNDHEKVVKLLKYVEARNRV